MFFHQFISPESLHYNFCFKKWGWWFYYWCCWVKESWWRLFWDDSTASCPYMTCRGFLNLGLQLRWVLRVFLSKSWREMFIWWHLLKLLVPIISMQHSVTRTGIFWRTRWLNLLVLFGANRLPLHGLIKCILSLSLKRRIWRWWSLFGL